MSKIGQKVLEAIEHTEKSVDELTNADIFKSGSNAPDKMTKSLNTPTEIVQRDVYGSKMPTHLPAGS